MRIDQITFYLLQKQKNYNRNEKTREIKAKSGRM